jgi:hypothetical protein
MPDLCRIQLSKIQVLAPLLLCDMPYGAIGTGRDGRTSNVEQLCQNKGAKSLQGISGGILNAAASSWQGMEAKYNLSRRSALWGYRLRN